jgi:hypothetical protein
VYVAAPDGDIVNEDPEQIAPEFTEIIGEVFVDVVDVITVFNPALLIFVVLNKLTAVIVVLLTAELSNIIPVPQLTILPFEMVFAFEEPCILTPIVLPQVVFPSITQLLD